MENTWCSISSVWKFLKQAHTHTCACFDTHEVTQTHTHVKALQGVWGGHRVLCVPPSAQTEERTSRLKQSIQLKDQEPDAATTLQHHYTHVQSQALSKAHKRPNQQRLLKCQLFEIFLEATYKLCHPGDRGIRLENVLKGMDALHVLSFILKDLLLYLYIVSPSLWWRIMQYKSLDLYSGCRCST